MYPTSTRSARLLYCAPQPDDLEIYLQLFGCGAVMTHIGGAEPAEATAMRLDRHQQHWREHQCGPWMVWTSDENEFVGYGGVQCTVIENERHFEIGYALLPAAWGRGFATEIAETSIAVAFASLPVQTLSAVTLAEHRASRQIMTKAGMSFVRDVTCHGAHQVLYQVNRDDWRR